MQFGHFRFQMLHQKRAIVIEILGDGSLGLGFTGSARFTILVAQPELVNVVVFLEGGADFPGRITLVGLDENALLHPGGVQGQDAHHDKVTKDTAQQNQPVENESVVVSENIWRWRLFTIVDSL